MRTVPHSSRSGDLEEVATRLAAAAEAAVRAGRRLPPHEPLAGQLDGMAHILWRFHALVQDAREAGEGEGAAGPRPPGEAGRPPSAKRR